MVIFRQCVLAALTFFSLTAQANASLIFDKVDFTAFWSTSKFSSQPPINPVTGSFNVMFDSSVSYTAPMYSGITMNSLNIAPGGGLNFESPFTGSFFIDTVPGGGGTNGVRGRFDNFSLDIIGITGPNPRLGAFAFSQDGINLFITNIGTVTITPITTVPLPASLSMFAAGILGLGMIAQRRKLAAA